MSTIIAANEISKTFQVTIELRDRLLAIGVSVQVKTFEEDEGIDGLGSDPFVSVDIRGKCTSTIQDCVAGKRQNFCFHNV